MSNRTEMDISDEHVLVIEHGRAETSYWLDLWRYRELFQVLAWRDISVRYKQTVIGAAWALIRPFLTMVVFTVIFGKMAGLPSDGATPYALMVFAGMLPWSFFSTALTDASNSLIGNANLISKVYFPRLIVPIAAVMVAFVDFLISFAILVALMVWYQFVPGWQILVLPVFVGIAFMASLGSACGSPRSTSSIGISATSSRSSFSWASTCRRSDSAQASCRSSGVLFIPSIRWSASSMDFVGACSGARAGSTGPASGSASPSPASFLWFGIRQFRKMEKSFADLI